MGNGLTTKSAWHCGRGRVVWRKHVQEDWLLGIIRLRGRTCTEEYRTNRNGLGPGRDICLFPFLLKALED